MPANVSAAVAFSAHPDGPRPLDMYPSPMNNPAVAMCRLILRQLAAVSPLMFTPPSTDSDNNLPRNNNISINSSFSSNMEERSRDSAWRCCFHCRKSQKLKHFFERYRHRDLTMSSGYRKKGTLRLCEVQKLNLCTALCKDHCLYIMSDRRVRGTISFPSSYRCAVPSGELRAAAESDPGGEG